MERNRALYEDHTWMSCRLIIENCIPRRGGALSVRNRPESQAESKATSGLECVKLKNGIRFSKCMIIVEHVFETLDSQLEPIVLRACRLRDTRQRGRR